MSEALGRRRRLRALGRRFGLVATAAGDCRLLDIALTHDSYAFEAAGTVSNERLEFLGDAVLGAIVAHALYEKYPAEPEGRLSRRRAALVSRSALAATCARMELGPLLRLGKGESAARGEQRPSILAAVFEAIVGAVYLCEGYVAAKGFVERVHLARAAAGSSEEPKSTLQEYAQARFKRAPTYEVTAESGPPHARLFTTAVSIGGEVLGTGAGPTKKQAEAAAASEALRKLRRS